MWHNILFLFRMVNIHIHNIVAVARILIILMFMTPIGGIIFFFYIYTRGVSLYNAARNDFIGNGFRYVAIFDIANCNNPSHPI